MIKHKRRPDYCICYHLGHCTETAFLIDTIMNLVRKNPCPRQVKSNRGRPPVHSRAKLDFICILMVAWHKTSRDMESDLSVIKIPWAGEPTPDHTTLARYLQTIPQDWLDMILTKTGQRDMIEGIFGGEESKRHQLHCRFINWDSHRRFGKIRAIAWNLKALNRLRCARMLGIEIPSYGGVVCA